MTCPDCPAWIATACGKPGKRFRCSCGEEYMADVPEPASEAYTRTGAAELPTVEMGGWMSYGFEPVAPRWQWTPNAREDMQAIAWVAGTSDPAPTLSLETDDDRQRREARRETRRVEGAKHLAWLRSKSPQYADVVWFVYGHRGETIGLRESTATAVAEKLALPGQKAAYRAWWGRQNKGKPQAFLDKTAPISFGNVLIQRAIAAYERDEWEPITPAEAVKAKSKREVFLERMAEALKVAKERMGLA